MSERGMNKPYGCEYRNRNGRKKPTECEFPYEGLLEYKDKDLFQSELLKVDGNKSVDLINWEYVLHRYSDKFQDRHCKKCKEPCTGDELVILDVLAQCYDTYCTMARIYQCSKCGESSDSAFERRSNKAAGNVEIYDVRLKGHPSKLIIKKLAKWTCPSCGGVLTGLRIPAMQQIKKGQCTLRLLKSMYSLELQGEKRSYIAEGYAVPFGTVKRLMNEYHKFVASYYEKNVMGEIILKASEGHLKTEIITIKKNRHTFVYCENTGKFYACIKELVASCEMQYTHFFHNRTIFANEDNSSSLSRAIRLCVSLPGLAPLRYRFLIYIQELRELMKSEERENRSGSWWVGTMDLDDICRTVASAKHLDRSKLEYALEILTDPNFYTLNDNPTTKKPEVSQASAVEKGQEIARFLEFYLYGHDDQWNQPLNQNHNKYNQCHIDTGAIDIKKEVADFIEILETVSMVSPYTLREQLSRIQYLNEPSLHTIGKPAGLHVRDSDGLPELEHTSVGKGIPIACMTHLLSHGLLTQGRNSTLCITNKQRQIHDCGLDCPFLDS